MGSGSLLHPIHLEWIQHAWHFASCCASHHFIDEQLVILSS